MKVNLQESILFPLKDKNWILKVLIGGLFFLASALFIAPVLFPAGYIMQVMRDAINKKQPKLPEWKDWENLLKDGFFALVISLVYLVPVMIIFSVFAAVCKFIFGLIPFIGVPMFGLSVMGMALLYLLVVSPLMVIGMCLFISTGELSSAFDLGKGFEIYRKGITEYVIISIIALTLFAISCILFFLLPFTGFYLKVVICRMYSEAFIKYAEEAEELTLKED